MLKNMEPQHFRVKGTPAAATFAIATPGRHDAAAAWAATTASATSATAGTCRSPSMAARRSRRVDHTAGPTRASASTRPSGDIPAGTRAAAGPLVGPAAQHDLPVPAAHRCRLRQPCGGFRPVKVTYVWEEGGLEKKDVHVAQQRRRRPIRSSAGRSPR